MTMVSGYEIAAIMIALAAVGIACWALSEARERFTDEQRLAMAEAAYMAHSDNLTKKARSLMVSDMTLNGLFLRCDECELEIKALQHRTDRAFEDLSIWREAIEQKLGVQLCRVEVPSQPGYSIYQEREEENG
jgi:hypothetical protein